MRSSVGVRRGGFGYGHAATATANLGVAATVTNNCTISTVALTFGSYDPVVANASANLDGTGTVVVACTKGATATIGLGNGGNYSGGARHMVDGSNFLSVRAVSRSGPHDRVDHHWRRTAVDGRCAFEGCAQLHGVRERREQSGRPGG